MLFYLGILLVIILIALIGIGSGRLVEKKGYESKANANAGLVAGALIGTLVGGSSTIGTSQLAFLHGFSAWWFTLGGGIAALLLAFVYSKPMLNSGEMTLPGIVGKHYGPLARKAMTILNSIGTFLSFVAQILSGSALLMSVLPLSFIQSVLVVSMLIVLYVYGGGALALGYGGLVKTILLCFTTLLSGTIALKASGGINSLQHNEMLPHNQFFNLVARGISKDLGAGLSLVVGVITTQSYFGALLTAKDTKTARNGALMTAVLVPVIGMAGIMVGLHMRVTCPDIVSQQALPMFIMSTFPPVISGVMMASLLVAVIGTGAGLSMGIASMTYHNIMPKQKGINEKASIRFLFIIVISLGAIICVFNLGDIILNWSFLSMGLRGAVAFIPLCCAMFVHKPINKWWVVASMIVSIIAVFISNVLWGNLIDPLFPGIGVSMLVMLIGYSVGKKAKATEKRRYE